MRRLFLSLIFFLIIISLLPTLHGQSAPLLPSTVDTLSRPLIVSDEPDHLYVDLNLFEVKFFKDTAGYNEYTKNGTPLVANEQWVLEYFSQSQWKQRGTPRSLEWTQISDFHVQVKRFYDDFAGTIFWVIFDVYSQDKIKISVNLFAGQTDEYRLAWKASGINTDFLDHDVSNWLVKCFDDPELLAVGLDYTDVYQEFGNVTDVTLEGQAKDRKVTMTFSLGSLNVGENVVVDPTMIGTSTSLTATKPFARPYNAQGRYWVWYNDGTNIVYRTSVTGQSGNWSSASNIRSAGDFSTWHNSTHVAYAFAFSNLRYRIGVMNSSGGITWVANEKTISEDNCYNPYLSLDSSGYPFIGYHNYSTPNYTPYVIKSSLNNGSWTTDSGFPYQLASPNVLSWTVELASLTSQKMYAMYVYAGTYIRGRLWNGASWSSEENCTSSSVPYDYTFSAVTKLDDVHIVFLKDSTSDIVCVKYSTSWGSETTVASSEGVESSPTISINNSTDYLYVFWERSDSVKYVIYDNSSWASPVLWFTDDIQVGTLASSYEDENNHLCVIWATTSSPAKVMFHHWWLLTVAMSASKTNPTSGEAVTISWTITRAYDGSEVTDFKINITKNGVLWKGNLNVSSAQNVETTYDQVTKTFGVSDVLDNTYGISIFESNTVTVTWTREWKESGGGGTGAPAEEKKELVEELKEALEPVLATITSQYVSLIILAGLILGFAVGWWKQHFALKLVFGTASILFFFNVLCVWVLVPMAILPSEIDWLKPFLWAPPSLTLGMFGRVPTVQVIQIALMFCVTGIFVVSVWGLTHRD